MPITLTVTDIEPGFTLIEVYGNAVLSGNYPSGGEPIDWTTIATQLSVRGQEVASSMTDPAYGPTDAALNVQGGTANIYNLNQGTTPKNWKMRGYTSGSAGAEFTGGAAYPAGALGDTIRFWAQFRRLT